MDIDVPGKECIIDDNSHGECDENLFNNLVANDISDPDTNQNNPNMVGGRQGAGQQGPQRMVSMRNLPTFSGEKTESPDNDLDAFDDFLEIQLINVVDANVAQIMSRFYYSLFGKAKKCFNQGREGRPDSNVAN